MFIGFLPTLLQLSLPVLKLGTAHLVGAGQNIFVFQVTILHAECQLLQICVLFKCHDETLTDHPPPPLFFYIFGMAPSVSMNFISLVTSYVPVWDSGGGATNSLTPCPLHGHLRQPL